MQQIVKGRHRSIRRHRRRHPQRERRNASGRQPRPTTTATVITMVGTPVVDSGVGIQRQNDQLDYLREHPRWCNRCLSVYPGEEVTPWIVGDCVAWVMYSELGIAVHYYAAPQRYDRMCRCFADIRKGEYEAWKA